MSDEMIEALGRFVTEVGDVEYVMFETILAVAEEDANQVPCPPAREPEKSRPHYRPPPAASSGSTRRGRSYPR
jgi:hypothetical protein